MTTQRADKLLYLFWAVHVSTSTGSVTQRLAESDRPYPEWLGEARTALGLTKTQCHLVERLVETVLDVHAGDPQAALATLGGQERLESALSVRHGDSYLDKQATVPMSQVSFPDEHGHMVPALDEAPGRYSQISLYARGGMGRVLLAYDEQVGRNVALKELFPGESGEEDRPTPVRQTASLTARFLYEARVTGQLEHPAIVPVYEIGRRRDGQLYYTMKLVRGKTFGEAIQAAPDLRGRLGLLPHFIDLCQAIAYAHGRNVIHRDIKPANVMIGQFGETVVLDWGLAKKTGTNAPHDEDLQRELNGLQNGDPEELATSYGKALGTPQYMPPEQAAGQIDDIDERSDVYGLGAVLHEMLSGKAPYTGASAKDIVEKVMRQERTPLRSLAPDAPPELVTICEKALSTDAGDRYGSAAELSEEVNRFLSGALVQAYAYSPFELARRFYRQRRKLVLGTALGLVALLCLFFFSYINISQARDSEREQRLEAETAQAREHEARRLAEYRHYVSLIGLAKSYIELGDFPLAEESLWQTSQADRNWEWGYLLGRCNQADRALDIGRKGLMLAEFDRDGSHVAALIRGGAMRVWDLQTGLCSAIEGQGIAPSRAFALSPTSDMLATGGQDGLIRLWDYASQKQSRVLEGHRGPVQALAFSRDGRLLLSASQDATAKIWPMDGDEEPLSYATEYTDTYVAEFSPDASHFLVKKPDGNTQVWNRNEARRTCLPTGTGSHFTGTDAHILTIDDGQAVLIDGATGQTLARIALPGKITHPVRINESETRALITTGDGWLRLWDLRLDKELAAVAHGGPFRFAAMLPGGSYAVACGTDSISVWDMDDSTLLARLAGQKGAIIHFAVAPSGRSMISCAIDGTIQLWDLNRLLSAELVTTHSSSVRALSVSPDSKHMASVGWDHDLKLADLTTNKCTAILSCFASIGPRQVAFSPAGRYLATVQDAFCPVVWDLDTLNAVSMFRAHSGETHALCFSPDGNEVASGGDGGNIQIWRPQTGEVLRSLAAKTSTISALAYDPRGRFLAAGTEKGELLLWDLRSGRLLKESQGGHARIHDLEFHPTDARLALASQDNSMLFWDVLGDAGPTDWAGHAGTVVSVSHSPDGSRLVTSSGDKSVRVWDGGTGAFLVALDGTTRLTEQAVFTPNGRDILLSSYDGTVRRKRAEPWRLAEIPGNPGEAAEERYAFHRTQERARLRSGAPQEPVAWRVLSTPNTVRRCLERLAQALEAAEPAPGLPATDEVRIEGALHDALALLCFHPGDRIIAINGALPRAFLKTISDERTRNALGADTDNPLSFQVQRGNSRLEGQVLCFESEATTHEVVLPQALGEAIAEFEERFLTGPPGSLQATWREETLRRGEGGASPEALSGLLVVKDKSEVAGAFYRAFGLVGGERITAVNDQFLGSPSIVEGVFRDVSEQLVQGDPFSLSLDVEQGQFRRTRVKVAIK